tara:strand:- start:394 stop:1887 length:1494 start_codon:yes stop_codon:yes gene_type:complete
MANENKKTNELVSDDDDPTSELETLNLRQGQRGVRKSGVLESEENTYDFSDLNAADKDSAGSVDQQAELKNRAATIERLQYDFEQLHSRWLGLKVEVASRSEVNDKLDKDLRAAQSNLAHHQQLLEQRDETIEKLRAQLRDRDLESQNLQNLVEEFKAAKAKLESGDEINRARQKLIEYEGAVAGMKAALSGLQNQQQQTEAYADALRRQLADLRTDSHSAVSEHAALKVELSNAESTIAALEAKLANATRAAENAESALNAVRDVHEQEMKLLRYELSEAQETLAENSHMSEQLASDLLENRSYKVELERMLTDTESASRDKIETLEKQVERLEKAIRDYDTKLDTKNTAINALLNELAKKGHAVDDDSEYPDEILYEEMPSATPAIDRGTTADRVTRLLIGRIDKQELRFPLFKNRLTIGRTQQNDIYLKAQYISRRHAVIVTEGETTRIIDWGSKNGIYVNSKRVTEHFLKSGDRVLIGTVEFRYEELPKRENS